MNKKNKISKKTSPLKLIKVLILSIFFVLFLSVMITKWDEIITIKEIIEDRMAQFRSEIKYSDIKEDIFACNSARGVVTCWDTEKNKLFYEIDNHNILYDLGFSKEEVEQFYDNYRSKLACPPQPQIKYLDIPQNVIFEHILKKDVFDSQNISQTICHFINSAGFSTQENIYSWNYNSYNFSYYHIRKSSSGGRVFITHSLQVEPYTTKWINIDRYPFLSCEDFEARSGTGWDISVKKEENVLEIMFENGGNPKDTLSIEEIDNILETFSSC